jgi:diguanylate cyclase (GGDEF)-like protein
MKNKDKTIAKNIDKKMKKTGLEAPSVKSRPGIITNPVHLLIVIAISIFLTEALVMLALSILPPLPIYQMALLDALLLITIAFPLLYVFFVKPYIAEHARMEEKLRAMSITDELTGLYNRRGFMTFANQQLKVANRMKRGVLLVYADFDGLKFINDWFGHQEGDLMLVNTANLLSNVFRESDIIARIGGDEFVVFSIETTDVDVETIRNRFEKDLEANNAKRANAHKISLSVGIVYYKQENPYSLNEILNRADQLMYEQKKHTRRFR